MTFVRIFCLFFCVVASPCRQSHIPFVGKPVDPLLKLLEKNSHHIRAIHARGTQGASDFDIRQLKNSRISNVYVGDIGLSRFFPRTHRSAWKLWRIFRFSVRFLSDPNVNVFVLTEGRHHEGIEGRLAGVLVLENTNGVFDLSLVEIDMFYQGRGLGKRLVREAFSIAKTQIMSPIRLMNYVTSRALGAWLYLSQARDAGYKFAHVAGTSSSPATVLPLEGLHKTSVVSEEIYWRRHRHFDFTMGRHPVYTMSPAKIVDGMHILKLDRSHADRMRERWRLSCPPDWEDITRLGHFESFFAFEPDSTDILQGALLLKTGKEYTMELLYMPEATANDRTLLLLLSSMFSDAKRQYISVVVLKANTLSDWLPVDKKAQKYKYFSDESNLSHEWRRYQLRLSSPR